MDRIASQSTLGDSTGSWISLESVDDQGHFIGEAGIIINGRYRLLEELGRGTFAVVWVAEDVLCSGRVAVKVVKAEKSASQDAMIEAKIMTKIVNTLSLGAMYSGVPMLLEQFTYEGHVCLVLPLYGKSLYSVLTQRDFKPLPVPAVLHLVKASLLSLRTLHSLGYIHCDLKPENIVQTFNTITHTTLIDFGSVYHHTQPRPRLVQTRYYRAPEVVMGKQWGFPVDVWSMGCIMYELLTGCPLVDAPGDKHLQVLCSVLETEVPGAIFADGAERKSAVSVTPLRLTMKELGAGEELISLMFGMLTVDPRERLTAKAALAHAALAGVTL